jgi:hypothetical protein
MVCLVTKPGERTVVNATSNGTTTTGSRCTTDELNELRLEHHTLKEPAP